MLQQCKRTVCTEDMEDLRKSRMKAQDESAEAVAM
jgi:hypothetical protein